MGRGTLNYVAVIVIVAILSVPVFCIITPFIHGLENANFMQAWWVFVLFMGGLIGWVFIFRREAPISRQVGIVNGGWAIVIGLVWVVTAWYFAYKEFLVLIAGK